METTRGNNYPTGRPPFVCISIPLNGIRDQGRSVTPSVRQPISHRKRGQDLPAVSSRWRPKKIQGKMKFREQVLDMRISIDSCDFVPSRVSLALSTNSSRMSLHLIFSLHRLSIPFHVSRQHSDLNLNPAFQVVSRVFECLRVLPFLLCRLPWYLLVRHGAHGFCKANSDQS